ncbi:MAG: hypothetical protein R3E73_14705 [Porticoccaceae bacterium]
MKYADYDWLTEKGGFVILNNGAEFSVTYFIMLKLIFDVHQRWSFPPVLITG